MKQQSGDKPCGSHELRCLHRRLVSTTLWLTGWLTLSGLHVRRPPSWLWLLRLLPLTAYLLVFLGAALLLISSPTEQQVVEGFSVYVFFLQTAVILVVFITKRNELDELDRQLEALSRHAACHNSTTRRRILIRIALFVLVAIINFILWIAYPIAIGNFTHGNYNFQMKIPDSMETPTSYWVCMFFQFVIIMLSCSLALAFDCCFFAWINSVEFHLTSVRRAIEKIDCKKSAKEAFVSQEESVQNILKLESVETRGKMPFQFESSETEGEVRTQTPKTIDGTITPKKPATGDVTVFLGSIPPEKERLPPEFADPAAALCSIDQHYRLITRLVSSINHLCGLPVLLTHAATMSNILFGLFASISLILRPVFVPGQDIHVMGYSMYIFIFFLRITFYSYDGGNIVEKNAAFVAALADMQWLELPERARLRRKAIMQKASQPLCINALGVFAINKINVLNIFSFVLTYLVIMIQMLTSVIGRLPSAK
ncbi:hypothetical protein FJT64_023180 [Amphibalanus amphitrite]|uniref:Odorant receptor n=1 Tax=Amphibalanus amphitrite TaxID=1232801 RepID=A0A6A4WCR1_AMPAM|nr:hypothetical protein FJT64_023180 [Amphibalanus amphitrite]